MLGRTSDIYTTFTAAMIDPLPEKQREFLAVMGLADEFTVEMAQFITGDAQAGQTISTLTEQNAFVKWLPDGITYRFHHMMKECAEHSFLALSAETQKFYLCTISISRSTICSCISELICLSILLNVELAEYALYEQECFFQRLENIKLNPPFNIVRYWFKV